MKHFLYSATSRLGLASTMHRVMFRHQVAIVMYHGVVREALPVPDWCFIPESAFAAHIRYLQHHFDVIPLRDVVERLRSGGVDRPTAVITFDDGYRNNFTVAWPILRAAGLPATIFPVAGLLDSSDTLWSCRLHQAITATRTLQIEWDGSIFDLRGTARSATAATLKRRLKLLPAASLGWAVRDLLRTLGDDPARPIEQGSPFAMLTREDVRAMSRSELMDFGGHTCSHSILSLLSDDNAQREIARSLSAIADVTGRPCKLFAYPNGHRHDYASSHVEMLRRCGVDTAVTTVRNANTRDTPPLELGRYGIGAGATLRDFQNTVHHIDAQLRLA